MTSLTSYQSLLVDFTPRPIHSQREYRQRPPRRDARQHSEVRDVFPRAAGGVFTGGVMPGNSA